MQVPDISDGFITAVVALLGAGFQFIYLVLWQISAKDKFSAHEKRLDDIEEKHDDLRDKLMSEVLEIKTMVAELIGQLKGRKHGP